MKLYILRHGEAEPGGKCPDFERQLTISGKETVSSVGMGLNSAKAHLDSIICSTAKRTRQTAEQVLKELDQAPQIEFREDLYNAPLMNVLKIISQLDKEKKRALLIGHNPSFSELAAYLLNVNYLSLSPGQLMVFDLSIDSWEELTKGCGTLVEG